MNLAEFQQKTLSSQKPIVIDFWAPWCVPCRATKPTLDKLASEFVKEVEFLPINADESQEVMRALKIYGIPTVLTFRDGKEVARVAGAQTQSNYRLIFDSLATGREIKVPLTQFARLFRLGMGAVFVITGLSTSSWILGGIGAVIAFTGIYDRCPIWKAITGLFKDKEKAD
jgi:thioredoxin 1